MGGTMIPGGLDEPQNLSHGNSLGGTSQHIPAFGAPAGFHEAALLKAGQNQLQKFLRNLLPPRDVGDFDGIPGTLNREIEDRLERIFAFYGDVHARVRDNLLLSTRDYP